MATLTGSNRISVSNYSLKGITMNMTPIQDNPFATREFIQACDNLKNWAAMEGGMNFQNTSIISSTSAWHADTIQKQARLWRDGWVEGQLHSSTNDKYLAVAQYVAQAILSAPAELMPTRVEQARTISNEYGTAGYHATGGALHDTLGKIGHVLDKGNKCLGAHTDGGKVVVHAIYDGVQAAIRQLESQVR